MKIWKSFPDFSTFTAVMKPLRSHINKADEKEGLHMKQLAKRIILLLFLLYSIPQNVFAADTLIPVGQVVGLELKNDRLTVAAFDDALGANARDGGLQVGDVLLRLDGTVVHTPADVQEALNHARGIVEVTVLRGGDEIKLRLNPVITATGPRLGVHLRQGVTGIGTVTWYDPETHTFGALGHGVNDSNGNLVTMTEGAAYRAKVQGVRPGKVGAPGQLVGAVTDPEPVGQLQKNAIQGLFGICTQGWEGSALPVCEGAEVHPGKAIIRSTVAGGEPREYRVEILKIYPERRADGRNMVIRITDPELLKVTGGIVQGMSGSPIIQDGKFVGAVTHVLINDPTRGYGIFIENMLEAAG